MTERNETYTTTTGETALVVAETREIQPSLTPGILQMFQQLDMAAYKSRRFGVTEGETVIKLLFCYENGLPLSTANTGLYVVKGKLQVESNVVAGQFKKHPSYDYRIKILSDHGCTIEVLRNGDVIGEASFNEEHAKRAGLLQKGGAWAQYPEDMYFNKAVARAYRRFAPDLFSQTVYVPGELDDADTVDATWASAAPVQAETVQAEPGQTLDELVARYGADAVLAANGGAIPATADEVAALGKALEAS